MLKMPARKYHDGRQAIVPASMYKSVLREIRWLPMAALVETVAPLLAQAGAVIPASASENRRFASSPAEQPTKRRFV
jgi:hypothetical protein